MNGKFLFSITVFCLIFLAGCTNLDLTSLSDQGMQVLGQSPPSQQANASNKSLGQNATPQQVNAGNKLLGQADALEIDFQEQTIVAVPSSPITYASMAHIFSQADDQNFEGEAFYVTFKDGKQVYIYSRFSDNPHDLANTQRKMQAIMRGVGSFTYPSPKNANVHIASKLSLHKYFPGSSTYYPEHTLLSESTYKELASLVRQDSEPKEISLVYYKDLQYSDEGMVFKGSDITGIDDISMTTGGSVYLFTVKFKSEKPLNIWTDTVRSDGRSILQNLISKINGIKGTDKEITVKSPNYQEEIYTKSGTRTGWTAPFHQVEVQ